MRNSRFDVESASGSVGAVIGDVNMSEPQGDQVYADMLPSGTIGQLGTMQFRITTDLGA